MHVFKDSPRSCFISLWHSLAVNTFNNQSMRQQNSARTGNLVTKHKKYCTEVVSVHYCIRIPWTWVLICKSRDFKLSKPSLRPGLGHLRCPGTSGNLDRITVPPSAWREGNLLESCPIFLLNVAAGSHSGPFSRWYVVVCTCLAQRVSAKLQILTEP